MTYLQDGLEQRVTSKLQTMAQDTVEIGNMLRELHRTADRREGGFAGICKRLNLKRPTAYLWMDVARRASEVSDSDTSPGELVAAFRTLPEPRMDDQDRPQEPAPQPEAEPADPAPPAITQEQQDRIDACLNDTDRPDADMAKMRGNAWNVVDGRMSPEAFFAKWERTPPAPAPETPAAPVVVTPVADDPEPAPAPEPPTERADVRPAEPRRSKAQEELDRARAELAEANRDKQMLLFEKEDLEQQVKVAEDKLAQAAGEASNVGGGIAGAELRKLQAEKRTWQGRAWEWQQKYEDERRLAAALRRQLKKYE